MNDPISDPLVRTFEAGEIGERFGHREHLYVAWCYLRALPLEDALARYVHHLRELTRKLGAEAKFHRTLTWTWVILLDDAMNRSPDVDFDALLVAHPALLDRRAPLAHYTDATISSPAARARFVLPERP